MRKKLTITLEEDVYEGLQQSVGRGKIGRFLEELARPHVVDKNLAQGYAALADDLQDKKEWREWSDGTISDIANEAW